MNRDIKKINNARLKYYKAISNLESKIIDRVKFDFFILYQEADNFVLCYDGYNSPLLECLMEIKKNGILTLKFFMSHRI